MSVDRAKACLRITIRDGSAAEVTRRLGLQPTSSHEIGEPRSARDPRPWPDPLWLRDSGLPDSRPLVDHLHALLDLVAPKDTELISMAADGYHMDWFCFISSDNGQLGLLLPPDLLARLGALPIDLDLDIYS